MTRFAFGLVVALSVLSGTAFAQTPPPKLKHLHGHDLKVRKAGEENFTPTTQKVGIEFFHDTTGNAIVALSETGSIAVAAFAAPGDVKKSEWLFAHNFRARKSSEETFTPETKKISVEIFRDISTNKLIFISDLKTIALMDAPAKLETDKEPVWHHALTLKVRGSSEVDFKVAKKIGLEVYKEGNSGGLVYVSETGSIATAVAPAAIPTTVKAPKALYGLKLQVRKADEGDFTEATKTYALEAFSDPNSGAMVYISETGSIATAPLPASMKTDQGVRWSHATMYKVRKSGEANFDKTTTKFGIEVFEDKNTGNLVYIAENGAIAVLAKK